MKRSLTVLIPLGLALLLAACASSREREVPKQTATGGEPYHGLIQYRAKDAKQAIIDPELLDASDAVIASGTKVIGVSVNGEARAYPLFILNNHQIVNDQVGGTPISASW